ncbi:MAG TPA: hypothetical protein VE843_09640, partial [Ktedonobacteraceae bacterium]|nr:hypothetical protein [Ktedonobacteraceae bacterium]
MRIEQIKEIANAVLYEGYLLYPYRQSAIKNRTRWTFGVVYPREYSEENGGIDPWTMRTECLVQGQVDNIVLDVTVRFLHLLTRTVVQPDLVEDNHIEANANAWSLATRFADEPLQEGIEREVSTLDIPLIELMDHPKVVEIDSPGGRITNDKDTINRAFTTSAGQIVREQQSIVGAVVLAAEAVGENIFKVSVQIENRSAVSSELTKRRDEVLFQSFISTHTILQVHEGSFISLLE